MDIGTAKPDRPTRERYRYHLVDLAEPSEEVTVAEYQAAGGPVLDRLAEDAHPAIIAGGSGLHFRALVDPLEFPPTDDEVRAELEGISLQDLIDEIIAADPGAGDVMDLANPRRVLRAVEVLRLTGSTPTMRVEMPQADAVRDYAPARPFVGIGLDPGEALGRRVESRFDAMLEAGFLDEVAALAPKMGRTARQAVGYKQLLAVVAGDVGLSQARDEAIAATVALAKRQRTFFRRDPRIRWIPWHHDSDARAAAAWSHLEESWIS